MLFCMRAAIISLSASRATPTNRSTTLYPVLADVRYTYIRRAPLPQLGGETKPSRFRRGQPGSVMLRAEPTRVKKSTRVRVTRCRILSPPSAASPESRLGCVWAAAGRQPLRCLDGCAAPHGVILASGLCNQTVRLQTLPHLRIHSLRVRNHLLLRHRTLVPRLQQVLCTAHVPSRARRKRQHTHNIRTDTDFDESRRRRWR